MDFFPLLHIKGRKENSPEKRKVFLPVLHPGEAEFSLQPSAQLSQPTELARQFQICKPKHTHSASCHRRVSVAEKIKPKRLNKIFYSLLILQKPDTDKVVVWVKPERWMLNYKGRCNYLGT